MQIRRGTGQLTTFASNITYQPFGPLKSLTWANGTTLQRTYDLDYRLTAQTVAGQSKIYTYDAHGNITQMRRGSLGNLDYSYDALDRLIEVATASQRLTHVYDATGNRTGTALDFLVDGEVGLTASTSYQYGANSNRMVQAGHYSVDTDASGNLTGDRTYGVTRQFFYDEQNRLSRVEINGENKAWFRYNPLGQRTEKSTPQGTTRFIYGLSGELLGETLFDKQGNKRTSQFYIWLEGMPLGGISVTYSANGAPANSTVFHLHSDHLNTPRSATNAAGLEVWEWNSPAFGGRAASGTLTINLRFPGQYYDAETGFHYNYFRDYDPETGRYVQSDPIGLNGGLNTYMYAEGNPISKFDFWGLQSAFPGVSGMSADQLSNYGKAQFTMNSPAVQAAQAREASTWRNLYAPDYVSAEASAYMMTCSVTYTRYGDGFCGCGVTRGYPSSGFGINASAGFLLSPLIPSKLQLNNYLTGYGASTSYYYGFGGAFAGNAAGAAINIGVGIGGAITPGSVNSQTNK